MTGYSYRIKGTTADFNPKQTDLPRYLIRTDDAEFLGFLASPPDSPLDPHLITYKSLRNPKTRRYESRWVEITIAKNRIESMAALT